MDSTEKDALAGSYKLGRIQNATLGSFLLGLAIGIFGAGWVCLFLWSLLGAMENLPPAKLDALKGPGTRRLARRLRPITFNSLREESHCTSSLTTNGHMQFGAKQLFGCSDHMKVILDDHFKKKGLPFNAHLYSVMYTSPIWVKEERAYFTVTRLFVWHKNTFFYATFFDENWDEIKEGRVFFGLALPCILDIDVFSYDINYAGPEDPRFIFGANGDLIMFFNKTDVDGKRKMHSLNFRTMETTRYYLDKWFSPLPGAAESAIKIADLDLKDHSRSPFIAKIPHFEKNWTPILTPNGTLYMVFNFLNFQLYDCTDTRHPCRWVQGTHTTEMGHLKGGSPYQRFGSSNYYFSLTYTNRVIQPEDVRIYRPCISIVYASDINDGSTFKPVGKSKVINFNNILSKEPHGNGFLRVMISPSIARVFYDQDLVEVSVNANDSLSYVVRIRGMLQYISQLIAEHELTGASPRHPPEYYTLEYHRLNKM